MPPYQDTLIMLVLYLPVIELSVPVLIVLKRPCQLEQIHQNFTSLNKHVFEKLNDLYLIDFIWHIEETYM